MKRGDELGYFAYGGSTVVALFPKSLMECVSPSLSLYLVPLSPCSLVPLCLSLSRVDSFLTGSLRVHRFDGDLRKNSDVPIETLVRVGQSIGHSVLPTAGFNPASVLRGGDIKSEESAAAGP